MLNSFVPQIMVERLTDLTPDALQKSGIRFLMLDFDNTIVPYTSDVPSEEMEQWLDKMMDSSVGICVVSNSKRSRVEKFCADRGISCVTHAKKPFSKGIRCCLDRFSLKPSEAALAGDQIFTDVLGANCSGLTSVLVTPIHLHNIWLKLRHAAELPFITMGKRRLNHG